MSMFDTEIRGQIRSARVKVKEDGFRKFRTVRMAIERDFDDDVAALLGVHAQDALEYLRSGDVTKVVIPIDAVVASGILAGKVPVNLEKIIGVKATCSLGKAKKDEDAPIKLKLEFDFPWHADGWAMLGDEAGDYIGLTLTRKQLDLPGTGKDPAGGPQAQQIPDSTATTPEAKANGKKRKGAGRLTTKSSHGDDHAEAAGEINGDPQQAATPEEAEEIRTQRLREQQAEDAGVWT